jgi:hypothetical protein
MTSNLNLWYSVKTGKLDPYQALKVLEEKVFDGGKDTLTYRRIKKFIATKQKPKADKEE